MTGLYVQAAHHAVLRTRDDRRPPRPRFVEYQADLHRMAGLVLDEATLTRGDQYTFVELADALLDRAGGDLFRDLGVLVTSYWTPEFDPDVSAFGPYLHHRHRLDCASFDLVDQGSISPALALLVLCDYLGAGPADRDGLLLTVEQTTVPAAAGAHFPGPSRSTAGAVRIGRRRSGMEILTVEALTEQAVLGDDGELSRLVARWCAEYDIDPAELTVRINRATFLYRRWAYAYGTDTWPCRVEFLPPDRTCTGLFRWLGDESTGSTSRFTAHVEEDVESLAVAVVLTRAVTP